MIIRGIVDEVELKRIKDALTLHGLEVGRPGEFRTWTEESQGECLIWVEVDVNEELGEYLARTGFWEGNWEGKLVNQIRCPHCGNTNSDQIRLRVKTICFMQSGLQRDDNSFLFAEEHRLELEDLPRIDFTDLICIRCKKVFENPGIPVR